MTLEEKQKLIYETYKKRSKWWSYKCDVFVFDTPKSFSNLFLNNNVINLRYSITKAKYNKLITESILAYPKFIWMHEGEGDCAFKDDMEMGTLKGGI